PGGVKSFFSVGSVQRIFSLLAGCSQGERKSFFYWLCAGCAEHLGDGEGSNEKKSMNFFIY
ncbi:MAG: hypothetical protein ACKOAX_02050, partial [Candidatus Kapaibacterium sp.]